MESGGSGALLDHRLGLGPHLVGRQICLRGRNLDIVRQLGEGGFSFVYLVRSKVGGVGVGGVPPNNAHRNDNYYDPGGFDDGRGFDGDSSSKASSSSSTPRRRFRDDSADSSSVITRTSNGWDGHRHRDNHDNKQRQHHGIGIGISIGGGSPSQRSMSSSGSKTGASRNDNNGMVLKITAISSPARMHMAEKEARLLRMLSHPSIVRIYDACTISSSSSNNGGGEHANNGNNNSDSNDGGGGGGGGGDYMNAPNNKKSSMTSMSSMTSAQHLILMEYCEGGTAFDAIRRMRMSSTSSGGSRAHGDDGGGGGGGNGGFDLSSLVIAFGQICNAVSYLHAQRPPIVHRDLKPVNFLIQRGAYKLCDFGSAIVGHVDLRTPENRRRAEDVIDKTTTPMFRAPEMIDLYMTRRLTESTDVWALGCSLYSMAYHRDCFEEGSALAILSRRYRIPENNPYGDDLVDLIDRMLAWDYKERADMSEVIMCLSALYSNRPLPKRRKRAVAPERTREGGGRGDGRDGGDVKMTGGGSYRTDGQGIISRSTFQKIKKVMPEAKKLDPNSAAAKRKRASEVHKRNDRHVQSIMHESSPRPNDGPSAAATGAAVDDFGFQDFASFDDGGFDGSFDDSMFYDTIEATLEETTTTNNDDCSFPLTFGEKCQISISTSTLGGGKDATSGDFSGANDDSKVSC